MIATHLLELRSCRENLGAFLVAEEVVFVFTETVIDESTPVMKVPMANITRHGCWAAVCNMNDRLEVL